MASIEGITPVVYKLMVPPDNFVPILRYSIDEPIENTTRFTSSNLTDQIQNDFNNYITSDLYTGYAGYNSTTKHFGFATMSNDLMDVKAVQTSSSSYQVTLKIPQDVPDSDVITNTVFTSQNNYISMVFLVEAVGNNGNSHILGRMNVLIRNEDKEPILPVPNEKGYLTPGPNELLPVSGTYYTSVTDQSMAEALLLDRNAKEYDPDNSYGAGEEQENPGDGSFDYSGDLVDVPDLPTISVTDSGFVRLFAPTPSELQELVSFMWSDAFSLDSFKKLFADPMDCILGLSIVPVNLPTGGKESITVGNIVSTVSCTICTKQYVKVDCGSFSFPSNKFTGSYLDYSPYLKVYLYLPYIGTQQIDVDEFMGATMYIEYHVDILTGAMFCFVSTTKGKPAGKKLVYTFAGQCSENVPLSSTSYGNTIASILQAASSIGAVAATAATGGAAAPVAASLLASATTSTANAATSMKPNIQHSGSVSGGSGIMGQRFPYLIFEAPWLVPVSKQEKYTGYASGKVVKLSSLSGFATIEAINLSVKGATDDELREIKRVLQEGVIL